MKVNIDIHPICVEKLRGVPYYAINTLNALVSRGENEYSISYFDYKSERGNRKYINRYIKKSTLEKVKIQECDKIKFSVVINGNIKNDASEYDSLSYEEYLGVDADVYHITQSVNIPFNITKPCVVTVHDLLPIIPQTKSYFGERLSIGFDNSMKYMEKNNLIEIIAVSESTKQDILKYYYISEDRIHVVPEAYDPMTHFVDNNVELLREMGIENPYLLYLGGVDYRKGIEDILDSFSNVKECYPDIKLVLAGQLNTSAESIVSRLENHKHKEDIILPGFVTEEQKRVLLSCAEVFLFPSEYEGFGLPVLEAMACGAPIITTNISSIPEVGGDAVMYVSPKRPEELTAAIEKMLSSESVRQDYIARGFRQCKKFSWDKTAAMTEEVYKIAYTKSNLKK